MRTPGRRPGTPPLRFLPGPQPPQRQQHVLDPVAQGPVARALGRRQDQGDGLDEVADGVVVGSAFVTAAENGAADGVRALAQELAGGVRRAPQPA